MKGLHQPDESLTLSAKLPMLAQASELLLLLLLLEVSVVVGDPVCA